MHQAVTSAEITLGHPSANGEDKLYKGTTTGRRRPFSFHRDVKPQH